MPSQDEGLIDLARFLARDVQKRERSIKRSRGAGTSPFFEVMDKVSAAGETRKVLRKITPAIIKEPGAKESFDDFASGKTVKSA